MSATPAAHLARLKVVHGDRWRIGRGIPMGPQFIAIERTTGERITAATVPELEDQLVGQAEARGGPNHQREKEAGNER